VVAEGLELVQEPRQFEDAYDTTLRIDIDRYAYDPVASTCRFLRINRGFYGYRGVKHCRQVAWTAIQWYGLTSFMGISTPRPPKE
jgi:hypothetical protein